MLFHARLILILQNFYRAAFSQTLDKVLIFMLLSERFAPLVSLVAHSLHIYVKKKGRKNYRRNRMLTDI